MGYYLKNGGLIGTGNIRSKIGVYDSVASQIIGDSLYDFSSFTFTTAYQTGRTGPTLSNLLSAYNTSTYPWLSDTNNFNVDSSAQGVQMWTVPATGTYRITVAGASGGYSYDTGRTNRVGRGAIVRGDFSFIKGDILRIVVGQRGRPVSTSNPDGPSTGYAYNSGGGGGSFVFYTLSDTEPLIVAGGGGGGSYSGNSGYAPDAATNITGNPGQGVNNNGSSLYSGLLTGQTIGYGGINTTGTSYKAGAGAGWKGNGGGGHSNCSFAPYHIQPGWSKAKSLDTSSSTSNGGPFMGGWGGNFQAGNGSQQGGFGGGGGGTGRCGSCQAGGGGGYTGGGIQSSNTSYPTKEALAGGGNYVNSVASNATYVSLSTAGSDGYVTIEVL